MGYWWLWWGLTATVVELTVVGGAGEGLIPLSRIAFGSCANQSASQEQEAIWNAIISFNPQLFIWMGDNIYGDIKRPFRVFGKERTIGPWKNVARFVPSSPQEMSSRYLQAKSNPGYSRLRRHPNLTIIGTWDDHDYGLNDAGKELSFPTKTTNQKLLLDFLDEPRNSPRRHQQGVYASYTFGPQGRQVKVILLDTRYHRDPLSSDGTILGDSQWTWLEKELNSTPSAITIIGSSIQRDGVIFISGDVHFGEITRFDCAATGYPLYDITSSGLTQAVENTVPSVLHLLIRFVAWLTPTTMRVIDRNCRYKSCTFGQPNFGAIEIDWATTPVTVRSEIRDRSGQPVASVNISLSDLKWGKNMNINSSNTLKKSANISRHCSLEVSLPWIVRYRLAILFYSTLAVLVLVFIGLCCVAKLAYRKCLNKCKHD